MADKLKLVRMQDRLGVFRSNLDEINFYIYGAHVSQSDLINRFIKGDQEAKKQLDTFEARQKEYMTPLLSELIENYGNGAVLFSLKLNTALEKS